MIAHKFCNLVPEIASIVEMSYGCQFLLENAQWCLIATFHRISTMIVSPAVSVLMQANNIVVDYIDLQPFVHHKLKKASKALGGIVYGGVEAT